MNRVVLFLALMLLAVPAIAQDALPEPTDATTVDGAGDETPPDEISPDDAAADDSQVDDGTTLEDDGSVVDETAVEDAAPEDSAPVDPQYEAERQLLNALAPLKRDQFTGFSERPLFTPSRTAPQPVVDEPVVDEPVDTPVETPVEAPSGPPNIQLTGVIESDSGRVAVVRDNDAGTTLSVKEGDKVGDWDVKSIDTEALTLGLDDQTQDFKLFQPGAPAPDGDGEPVGDPSNADSPDDMPVDENGMPLAPGDAPPTSDNLDAEPLSDETDGLAPPDMMQPTRDVRVAPDRAAGFNAREGLAKMRQLRGEEPGQNPN